MKTKQIDQTGLRVAAGLAGSLLAAGILTAGEAPAAANAAKEEGPPLPLHQIEGNGGIFSTLSAYLVNPPAEGEWYALPALGAAFVDLGNGRNLEALTLTQAVGDRLELGYGYDRLDIGDLPQAIQNATSVSIREDRVDLHNLNARIALTKEGEYGQDWLPAFTFGVHYKQNSDIDQIDRQLGGALSAIGIKDDRGVDFTWYGSKLLKGLGRPVLVNAGLRATEAAHLGLLGFTGDYTLQFEGSVGVFLTDRLILAAEYRGKPDEYRPIPGLIAGEDDWWTIDLAYVVNSHFTVAAGYGHFGSVLNHDANEVLGVTIKQEF